MPIEAIFLDIGGVLWLPKGPPLRAKWAARCGIDPVEFDRIVYGSERGEQALLGAITSEEMWGGIGEDLNLSSDNLRQLEQDYWSGEWNHELLETMRTLKPSYRLGIISNAESNTREAVKPWVDEALFDVIVFSAEESIWAQPDFMWLTCSASVKTDACYGKPA